MGFPMHPGLTRAALIGIMLGGGLLYAGISQAQESESQMERGSELVAAAGGPASSAHLIAFAHGSAAVDARDDDVALETPAGADAASRPGPPATPASTLPTQTAPAAIKPLAIAERR